MRRFTNLFTDPPQRRYLRRYLRRVAGMGLLALSLMLTPCLAPTAVADSTAPDWSVQGQAPSPFFGNVVASAGDVNQDGYADVVVGAPDFSGAAGKVYLYLGSPNGLSPSPAWTATGAAGEDWFAVAVAGAGDVNNDGYADVIVGAPDANGNPGKVYLYLGGPTGLSPTPAWVAAGTANGDMFGNSVAAAGDVNDDGYADVIVGAPDANGSLGKAYLYLGGPTGLSPTPAWTAAGTASNGQFGFVVASAGDVNHDGYADVIAGAPGFSEDTGQASLYLGGPTGLSPTPAWTATGAAINAEFASALASAGDANKDGYADVIVGAYGDAAYAGGVYLYLGGPAGLSPSPAWTATGAAGNDWFGFALAGAGDMNRDGYADVIAGTPGYDGHTGQVRLYLGGPTGLAPTAAWTAGGNAGCDWLVYSVAGAGDVNKDGYAELIVGASACSLAGDTPAGKAYGFYAAAPVPVATIAAKPNNPTSATSANFTFTATYGPASAAPQAASFTCSLDANPPASCTSPASYSRLTEGTHTFTVTASGPGGSASPAVYTWLVDTTPPTATASAWPPPNAVGWNHGDVTVTFSAADTGSGVAACTAPAVLSQEGAYTTITGVCTDRAGNTSQPAGAAPVKLDKTAPVVTGCTPTPPPDGLDWYTAPPGYQVTGSDELSGLATCTALNYTHAAGSLAASAVCTDQAGNSSQPFACAPVPYRGDYRALYLPYLAH